MKRKTFLATLILFLFFFYGGIAIVSVISLNNTVKAVKSRALDEHYFITASLVKDFVAVEKRGGSIELDVLALLIPYSRLSSEQKVQISFYQKEKCLYSGGSGLELPAGELPYAKESRRLSMQTVEGKGYVIVDGYFPAPYESYRLFYQYDISQELAGWTQMERLLLLAGTILSAMMAFSLSLVIGKLFRPLHRLTMASKRVAAGEYDIRLPIGSGEELDDLSASFNTMAEKIGQQIDTLQQEVQKRQRFVDNFAHELRTPLTAIYGYAEYLQKSDPSEEDKFSSLSHILSQSQRLQLLSGQLLELAGLRGGTMEWQKVDLAELFSQLARNLEDKLRDKNISLKIDCHVDYIYGDPSLLLTLLLNLTSNAIQASNRGDTVWLTATICECDASISVRDQGKGMSDEVLPRITEPFYRGDKARNWQDGGTGLGLAICADIVKKHGARLLFKSVVSEGTEVIVTFTTPLHPHDKLEKNQSYTDLSGEDPQNLN